MNKLTWEEFKLNQKYVVTNDVIERELLEDWFKENDYEYLEYGVKHKYESYCGFEVNFPTNISCEVFTVYQLEWKKDLERFTTKYQSKQIVRMDCFSDFLIKPISPLRFNNDYMGIPMIEQLATYQWNHSNKKAKVFPKVEMLNFNKDKGTTTIKFKNGNIVKSKVNPTEKFNEFTGVLVTLLKEVTGMSNQELQGYFKYIMRKEIK